jgi:hypothetical protein
MAYEVVIPHDFYYNDKVLEPYCLVFPQDNSKFDPISLADCSNIEGKITITDDEREGDYRGFVGYSYKTNNTSSYIYYKYLGEINGITYLWTLSNHGKNITIDKAYSEIIRIKKTAKSIILVMDAMGGSRCNGGIDRASIIRGKFSYDQKITPFDFLVLTGDYTNNLRADEDLASCSVCCAGLAHYDDIKFSSVTLTRSDFMSSNDIYGKYQICFNKLFDKTLIKKNSLNIPELKSFIDSFNLECVKNQTDGLKK